jgi:hypothetical protein
VKKAATLMGWVDGDVSPNCAGLSVACGDKAFAAREINGTLLLCVNRRKF